MGPVNTCYMGIGTRWCGGVAKEERLSCTNILVGAGVDHRTWNDGKGHKVLYRSAGGNTLHRHRKDHVACFAAAWVVGRREGGSAAKRTCAVM